MTARIGLDPVPGPRWREAAGLLGATVNVVAFVLYVVLLHSQQGDNGLLVGQLATFIGLIACLSIYAATLAVRGRPTRRYFLVAGSLNVAIGVVALFSVGALFLVSGALLLYGAGEGHDTRHRGNYAGTTSQ